MRHQLEYRYNSKVFTSLLRGLLLLTIPLFATTFTAYASPLAGYVVNEKTKQCTITIVGDESGDFNLGDCKELNLGESFTTNNPREVCESNGYVFESGDYTAFCRGSKVGLLLPLSNYQLPLKVVLIFMGIGCVILLFKKALPKYKSILKLIYIFLGILAVGYLIIINLFQVNIR